MTSPVTKTEGERARGRPEHRGKKVAAACAPAMAWTGFFRPRRRGLSSDKLADL
jgi:hypothetical protein